MIINTHIKPHLAEYLQFKYGEGKHISLPNYLQFCLLNCIRPITNTTKLPEQNNVSFVVTGKKFYDKSKEKFTLSSNSRAEFQKEVDWCFWCEAESFIQSARRNGESLSSSYFSFLEAYHIESISYDAVKKHFARKKTKKVN